MPILCGCCGVPFDECQPAKHSSWTDWTEKDEEEFQIQEQLEEITEELEFARLVYDDTIGDVILDREGLEIIDQKRKKMFYDAIRLDKEFRAERTKLKKRLQELEG